MMDIPPFLCVAIPTVILLGLIYIAYMSKEISEEADSTPLLHKQDEEDFVFVE